MFTGRSLAADVLAVGAPYPLALTGGCALRAHGVVGWSRGVGVATEHPARLEWIASQVAVGLGELGWEARVAEKGPLFARLVVGGWGESEVGGGFGGLASIGGFGDPVVGGGFGGPALTGDFGAPEAAGGFGGPASVGGSGGPAEVSVSLCKEVFCRPPVETPSGLALALPDAMGVTVRDFVRRGYGRDLARVAAGADLWSWPELEELGRRHSRDGLELPDLQGRLIRSEWLDDTEFTGCADVGRLRRWAQLWADDIGERLLEGGVPEER
ncbi:hypothetical protein [Streptomyces sp. 4F14]|uniref:hypothetical protein n=1 Tax=Streptomyces sp. 4F14 TaxID=3394380 RepID=UPI003A890B20